MVWPGRSLSAQPIPFEKSEALTASTISFFNGDRTSGRSTKITTLGYLVKSAVWFLSIFQHETTESDYIFFPVVFIVGDVLAIFIPPAIEEKFCYISPDDAAALRKLVEVYPQPMTRWWHQLLRIQMLPIVRLWHTHATQWWSCRSCMCVRVVRSGSLLDHVPFPDRVKPKSYKLV